MLVASYLYLLCQAYDLRAMQKDFKNELSSIVSEELHVHFGAKLDADVERELHALLCETMYRTFDKTSTMDAAPRMIKIVDSCNSIFVDKFTAFGADVTALTGLSAFRVAVATRTTNSLVRLRREYLNGARGPAPPRWPPR